jgi:mannose-6-phosphate isomerase-like protein (cupin superfamily)
MSVRTVTTLNLERETILNPNYRVVIYTGEFQLVLMSLKPQEEIGCEAHENSDQFFRVERGNGLAILNGISYVLTDGASFVVPCGTFHNIINTSTTENLKLYTIYSHPQHNPHAAQKDKPADD